MNRFWGLKLAAMQKTVGGTAQVVTQPAPAATAQADAVPKQTVATTGVAKTGPEVMPVQPPNWGVKTADVFTDEGREMMGSMLGGLGGLTAGTAALEGLGQIASPFKYHGGYGPMMIKILRGGDVGGVGKGLPARIALAMLMGLPYGLSMTAGQGVGGRMARSYENKLRARQLTNRS